MSLADSQSPELQALADSRRDLWEYVENLTLGPRQRQAVAAWRRLTEIADESQRAVQVSKELGNSPSATRQLLARAGVLRTKPSHYRQRVVERFREGASVAEVQAEGLVANRITLQLAIADYAAELLANRAGETSP